MGIPWSDHQSRREQIVDAAEAVFLAHGYAEATLAQVAKRSSKAVGSGTYLVGKKPELAREVHRRLTDRLAEQLGHSSLGRSGKDLGAVVRRAVGIALRWYETSLAELNLIAALECYPLADDPAAGRLSSKLSRVLALEIQGRRLLTAPKLDGARLFALILAPVFAEGRLRPRQGSRENRAWVQMADALTAAAMAALTSTTVVGENDLLKGAAASMGVNDLFGATSVGLPTSQRPKRTKASRLAARDHLPPVEPGDDQEEKRHVRGQHVGEPAHPALKR